MNTLKQIISIWLCSLTHTDHFYLIVFTLILTQIIYIWLCLLDNTEIFYLTLLTYSKKSLFSEAASLLTQTNHFCLTAHLIKQRIFVRLYSFVQTDHFLSKSAHFPKQIISISLCSFVQKDYFHTTQLPYLLKNIISNSVRLLIYSNRSFPSGHGLTDLFYPTFFTFIKSYLFYQLYSHTQTDRKKKGSFLSDLVC